MKNILKYLRRIKDLFLIFRGDFELRIEEYTDSDFISDLDNRISTSGYVFACNGSAVSWKSFKQPIIADLTIEAEYVAASNAAEKSFWFKKFIVKLVKIISDAILLYCDNNETIALAKKLKSHQKFKHIEQRFHIIHDYLKKKYVEMQKVDSIDNMTDLLIK